MSRADGISDMWKRLFVYESNLLAYNQSFYPGSSQWDYHYKTLNAVIELGAKKTIAALDNTHLMLCGTLSIDAGDWRTFSAPDPSPDVKDVPKLAGGWMNVARAELDNQVFKVEQEAHKRIMGLHYDLIHIKPFNADNERLARLMAVNLCLVADVDPLMFLYENRSQYEKPILDARV